MTATVFLNMPLSIARARVRKGIELTEADRRVLEEREGEPTVDVRYGTQALPAGSVVLAVVVKDDDGKIHEVAEPGYLEEEEKNEYDRALAKARAFLEKGW